MEDCGVDMFYGGVELELLRLASSRHIARFEIKTIAAHNRSQLAIKPRKSKVLYIVQLRWEPIR